MTKRMLIDATQAEETRVAVIEGDRIDSYDFDSSVRKQIKGNIFLAKVTRVEPSLQACFVEYGGNRQGFLAFTEIHPDYYRIPIEDRQALLAEEAELFEDEDESDDQPRISHHDDQQPDDMAQPADGFAEPADDAQHDDAPRAEDEFNTQAAQPAIEDAPAALAAENDSDSVSALPPAENITEVERDNTIERVGGEEENGAARRQRIGRLRKRYKIQEVIKRRQIMLVQATKEERGQKGAAMTTYISLPGRYCVLMPNSPRGGGVSRKITDPRARRKMKDLLTELEIPQGMSVILRTAGITRSSADIKRDLEYLLKLWDEIRRETMQSVAPALIYEEADIFKRAIRDLYSGDTSEIIVAGEAGYRKVKTVMHQMVPAHSPRVKFYRDPRIPLFQSFGIEYQIADIFSPRVDLRSGGYIIINPTEALVSIDVNSGRATRERHIDDTALKTNLEAATEIARQLRLRDLGGLVVIDFIDMDSNRNNAKVERRLREAMSSDRARIEIGRISGFGLLELSRQRLHPSLTETHFEPCPHCNGTGLIRTLESAAVVAMRAIEAEAVKQRATHITAHVPQEVAVYILNHKREAMNKIEDYFGCRVSLSVDEEMQLNDMNITIEKGQPQARGAVELMPVPFIEGVDDQPIPEEEPETDSDRNENDDEDDSSDEGERRSRHSEQGEEGAGRNRNRRSRSRRGGRNRNRRGPRSENDQNNGDAVQIPIVEGVPENGENFADGNTAEPAGQNEASGEDNANPQRRHRRGGGRHPYRQRRDNRNRDGQREGGERGERRAIQAADAPVSEPASIITMEQPRAKQAKPQPANEPVPASSGASSGEEKRWWQKLIE